MTDFQIKLRGYIEDVKRGRKWKEVSVVPEETPLPEKARGVIRFIVEYTDEIVEAAPKMQPVTIRLECSSRADNARLAREIASAMRRELPAKIEDGTAILTTANLESDDTGPEGRYQIAVVFDGAIGD